MKKHILILLTLCIQISLVFAEKILFEQTTWPEIKAKAKKEKKLIFVDAYTTWCGPCKMMEKNVFTNDSVAKYYNSNFINAKIDMEKGEGVELAKTYEVQCYPNLLFIDGDGNLIHRAAGYKDTAAFIALGKDTKNPEATFAAAQKRFQDGNMSPASINGYLVSLAGSCLSANDAAVKFLNAQKEEQLTSAFNWNILRDYVTAIRSAPMIYLVNHREAFIEKYTADTVNNKIFNTYLNHANKMIRSEAPDREKIDKLKGDIEAMVFTRGEELSLNIELAYAESKAAWDDFFNAGKVLAEKYNSGNAEFLNNISWQVFEKIDDKAKLETALEWAKKSVEIKESAFNMDTYANLLFKTGDKKLAIEKEKRAIELAKAIGMDTKDLEETLKRFQGGKK